MTIEELIQSLKNIKANGGDEERDHSKADRLLLDYINNQEVSDAFDAIDKWYA